MPLIFLAEWFYSVETWHRNVRDLDQKSTEKKASTNNMLSWQENVGFRKSALDYSTLWRDFRNCFSFENISRVFWNTIIVKTIRSWTTLSREFTYKWISTINILHTYFYFLTFSVHSHSLILRYYLLESLIIQYWQDKSQQLIR